MFQMFKKSFSLVAPVTGKVMDLKEVPDPVFAEKMVGDGVAIAPTSDTICAPADGKLTLIFKTNHAFGMVLENGIELLVHIGLDTVELQGEGFTRIASEGSEVKAGDAIVKIDRDFLQSKGCSLITPVIITNPTIIKDITYNIGKEVTAAKDEVLSYKLK